MSNKGRLWFQAKAAGVCELAPKEGLFCKLAVRLNPEYRQPFRRLKYLILQRMGRYAFKIPASGSQSTELDLRQLKSILVLRLDEIGDMVLTTPFLRELRRNAPQAWITLVVKPDTQNLVEFCPYVNEVLVFDWRLKGRLAALRRHAKALMFARKHLWRRFDLALVPRWGADYYEATYLAYMSGTPRRVAYSEHCSGTKARLNQGYDQLLTQTFDGRGAKHEVELNLELLQLLGREVNDSRLELWLTEDDRAFARKIFAAHGVGDREPLIALSPGSGAKTRCWPIERWVELGRRLNREFDSRLVVVGSKGEKELGTFVENALGSTVINLVGCATLRQTSAILERCSLTVSNDSGPMHLAAAAGSPAVEISCHPRGGDRDHCNSPTRFHPWGVPYVVLQPEPAAPSCSNSCKSPVAHCILGIEVESVQQAVRNLLPRIHADNLERREAANAD
jgi:ADP-heptose:LPS heptosyltransferase